MPLTVSFPEGSRVTSSLSVIPVEISFTSKKPIAFTTVRATVFEDDGVSVMA
jgi:hypothetical protein